ncbi:MAG: PAS domain-containing protein, partial [Chitinophagaceae bacterium]
AWKTHIGNNSAFNTQFIFLVTSLITIIFASFVTFYFSYRRRVKAEAMLTENKNLLQAIIDNTSSIVYLKDLAGKFLLVNRQFAKTFKMEKEELIGKTVFDFCPPVFAVQYTEADQVVFQQRKLVEVEEDGVVDGETQNFYSIKFPLYHQNGELYALAGISTNITNVLNKQQLVQQREIAETTILAQEKERTEIGKELHDNVNQLLATARLMIETSITMPEMQDECMQVSKDAVEDAIKEIRAISHSMLPPPFEDEAFSDAIKDIANNINISGNLKVEVQMPSPEKLSRIDNNLKLSLYRIIQEQVSNMLKYSNARTACIRLEIKNDQAHLSIVDNGIGADMQKRPKGVGLRNIASRVEIHKGELKIKTAPNEGFGLYTRFIIGHNGERSIA